MIRDDRGRGHDITLSQHVGLREEADIIETNLFSTYQRHFQVVSGVVFNF